MDEKLNAYLETVEKRLKSLPASERVDIIQEIKSEMLELHSQGLSSGDILDRLGNPKELAAGYLGQSLAEGKGFSLRRFAVVFSFCCYVGLGSVFLLPLTSVAAVGFLLCGVLSPLAGIARFVCHLFGSDLPQFQFVVGSYTAGPVAFLPISFVVGAVCLLVGWLCWRITLLFVRSVSRGIRRK